MSSWFDTYGFAQVGSRLWMGAYPVDDDDVAALHAAGVDRILNLVSDSEYRPGDRERLETALMAAEIEERRRSLVDFGNLPDSSLDLAVDDVLGWLADDHMVYVHCRAGWQRSAAVSAAVVAIREQVEIGEALLRVKARKPTAEPLEHQQADLLRWWASRARGS
jgi:protein-tyrosine phosphatase